MGRLLFVLAAAWGVAASAQPLIYGQGRGVVNAASFMPPSLPGGSIARGSLFTIFGTRLGPGSSPALAFPLSTTLGGVQVQVVQGSTTVNAIPVYVSAGQINAILPSNAPLGKVSVYVLNGPAKSSPAPAVVVTDSFGIFGTIGPGILQNFVNATTVPLNQPSVAATPGQTMILYGTGLGAGLNADNVAPQAGNLPTKIEVFVGGQAAAVSYSGRSPCCSGLDQIAFTVPSGAPLGCWVPVQIRTNGVTVSNSVTMAISADGSPCADAANALTAPFLAGKKIGLVGLLRADINETLGFANAGDVITDTAMVTFQQENPVPALPFSAVLSLPPAGACTAYTSPGDLFDGDPLAGANDAGVKFLNGGASLTVAGSGGSQKIARPSTNERNFQPLGYSFTGLKFPSLFLNPGSFTVSGAGGADVGSFSQPVTVAAGLTWSNQAQTTTITRGQGFTVNWSSAPAGQQVVVFGGGIDIPTNSSAIFVCLAAANATSFTVPGVVLGNIPATRANLVQSKGAVYVGSLPTASPTGFSASGIDIGAIVAGTFIGKTVIFQ